MKIIILLILIVSGFSLVPSAQANDIPIDRIILSTSGLAQFEHRTQVTGNASLEFPVRLNQVDDILKSLVVFDTQGRVGGVTLPGKQPLDQIFKDLPFDRNQLTSAMTLLNAYQGAVVTVKDANGTATGKIIQVVPEVTTLKADQTITRHRLSLMTDTGVKQAILEDLQSLQFVDAKVRNEVGRALDAIRENSAAGRRILTVNLLGSATRPVTLSYVVAAPLWKTAYRMVVPEAGKTTGFLQGWAVVENMTAGDWSNVDLSLVSGNPVTFRQALYQSYYVERPEIPVQVFGLVLPHIDEGTIASAEEMQAERDEAPVRRARQSGALMNFGAAKSAVAAPMAMGMGGAMASNAPANEIVSGVDSVAAMANVAQSAEAATQVLFHFPDRLSLKSGQSMMLPFVSRMVPMERVSLYQPDTNPKHPFAAVDIKNDGESGLPPGVLTLYEDSRLLKGADFSGDAQLPTLAPGEKRLISYALDSKTTIDRHDKSTMTEGQMTASRGVIKVSVKSIAETTYTVKAPAKEARVVVIEHPRMGDYRLVEPDPKTVEVTDTHFRIKTAVKAGEVRPVRVVLENQLWQSYGINGMPADQLMAYATGRGNLEPAVRKSFESIAALRRALDQIDQKIAAVEEQRRALFQDQERVRENLKSLTVKSDVQQKYLDKLNTQEDQVARLDKEKQELSEQRRAKQADMQDKIADLEF
ncbi:MAG: DUF4139 domain-containing protein [Proteobacteria bacterium]|nr:DUF4139 domain-containing protein [Pseudomonadota bacterium]